jgi:hypothetical protein
MAEVVTRLWSLACQDQAVANFAQAMWEGHSGGKGGIGLVS